MGSDNNLFTDKGFVEREGGNMGANDMGENGLRRFVYNGHSRLNYNNLFTVFKIQEKMATIKMGWILYNLLGWPPAIASLLSVTLSWIGVGDIVLGEIARPYKDIILIVGIIFLLTKVAIGIEVWVERRISNKRRAFELKKEMESYINSQSK